MFKFISWIFLLNTKSLKKSTKNYCPIHIYKNFIQRINASDSYINFKARNISPPPKKINEIIDFFH